MSITYTREYTRAVVDKADGSFQDVIRSIYCVVKGEDTETGATYTVGEMIPIPPGDPNLFVAFESVTQADCDGWVMPTAEYLALELKVAAGIAEVNSPTVVQLELPFVAQP